MNNEKKTCRIAVLGAGRMGSAITAMVLTQGHAVTVTTSSKTSQAEALTRIRESLPLDWPRDSSLLTWSSDTAHASSHADIVIECLPEDMQLKRHELAQAQANNPNAVLATNTSSFSVVDLGRDLADPGQLLAAHFLYPPGLFRVMELVPSVKTKPNVLEYMSNFLTSLGLDPVRLRRETPGFIINRLQFAMLREATKLVHSGIASAADVDKIVSEGLAPRWLGAGPLATATLGGEALFHQLATELFPELCRDIRPPNKQIGRELDPTELQHLHHRRVEVVEAVMQLIAEPNFQPGRGAGEQSLI